MTQIPPFRHKTPACGPSAGAIGMIPALAADLPLCVPPQIPPVSPSHVSKGTVSTPPPSPHSPSPTAQSSGSHLPVPFPGCGRARLQLTGSGRRPLPVATGLVGPRPGCTRHPRAGGGRGEPHHHRVPGMKPPEGTAARRGASPQRWGAVRLPRHPPHPQGLGRRGGRGLGGSPGVSRSPLLPHQGLFWQLGLPGPGSPSRGEQLWQHHGVGTGPGTPQTPRHPWGVFPRERWTQQLGWVFPRALTPRPPRTSSGWDPNRQRCGTQWPNPTRVPPPAASVSPAL